MSGDRGNSRTIRLLPFAAAASRLQTPALSPQLHLAHPARPTCGVPKWSPGKLSDLV